MAQRMTNDEIFDTLNRFRQAQEKKMPTSKTPTWDMVQQHYDIRLDAKAPFPLSLRDFNLLRDEVKALRNEQSKDEVLDFCTRAGSAFGGAIVKALTPLLGGK
jgi:hypothetical protein